MEIKEIKLRLQRSLDNLALLGPGPFLVADTPQADRIEALIRAVVQQEILGREAELYVEREGA